LLLPTCKSLGIKYQGIKTIIINNNNNNNNNNNSSNNNNNVGIMTKAELIQNVALLGTARIVRDVIQHG